MTYLSREEFRKVSFESIKEAGKYLYKLRFRLPEKNTKLVGLYPCEYISIQHGSRKDYIRDYSPISPVIRNTTHIDIIVKDKRVKRKSIMVEFLLTRKPGDIINMKIGGGYQYQHNQYTHFGLIVGGSGCSPSYQVFQEKVSEEIGDKTKLYLLFGAPFISQFLHMEEFVKMAEENEEVKVNFILSRNPTKEDLNEANMNEWKGFLGYASSEIIEKTMPPPGEGVMILSCGPLGMMKFLKGILGKMGYTDDMTYFFM